MKRLFAIFAGSVLFFSCQSTSSITKLKDSEDSNEGANVLTRKEKAEGWKLLYDGKSTKGWHVYLNKSDGSAWKSVNGALTFDPSQKQNGRIIGGGDIVTDEIFENFHFTMEWKVSQGANSGIIFLVQEDKKYEYSWHTGPEMQVLDNNGHPDAKITKHRAGDLYDLIQCSKETVNPYGKWNKADIRYENDKLELFLNGELVVSTKMHDANWDRMVAESKFKRMPDFGKFRSGRIAIQDHGDQVWFRNIKIRKL